MRDLYGKTNANIQYHARNGSYDQGFSLCSNAPLWSISGPSFNACRYLLGALSLLPVIRLNDRKLQKIASQNDEGQRHMEPTDTLSPAELRKIMILGSLACGFFNWAGSVLVQVGLVYTAASKAAFIGSLYIVIVPIIGPFFKKKTTRTVWLGVGIAVIGLYFLCIAESFSTSFGDLVIFIAPFLCHPYSFDRNRCNQGGRDKICTERGFVFCALVVARCRYFRAPRFLFRC